MQAVNVPKPQPQSTDNAPNQQSDRSPRQLQSDRAARAHRAHREPEPDATGAPDRAAKMRAVQQSAQCANQARSGGKFQKTKHKKAKTATTVQLSTDQAPAELSNSDMTSILQQLDVAYQSVVQTALNQANSEILHSIQSSHLSLPSERGHAVQLWEQARASAAAAIEMINIPTLTQANLNSVANHPPPPKPQKRKRKLVIPTGISSHKSQRRSNQGIGHTKRDSERRIAQMKADTTIAVHLQSKVKTELHYSERRLVGVAAYYKAKVLGMSKAEAAEDAARSMDVGASTIRRRGYFHSVHTV